MISTIDGSSGTRLFGPRVNATRAHVRAPQRNQTYDGRSRKQCRASGGNESEKISIATRERRVPINKRIPKPTR